MEVTVNSDATSLSLLIDHYHSCHSVTLHLQKPRFSLFEDNMGLADGRNDRWTDGRNGRTDGPADGRIDGQTRPLIETQGHI